MISLDVPDEFLLPNYAGGSIANIPATISNLLDSSFDGLPPLQEPFWKPLAGQVRRVVLILIDSLGWNMYQQQASDIDWFRSQAAVEGKLTSVFPSTTVVALSSLWTGYAPAQHGMVGLRLFFPDEAILASMLRFSPTFASFPGSLAEAGVEPELFLYVPGFAEQLSTAGIPSHSFKGRTIVNSSLSQMLDRGVQNVHGIVTAADLFVQMRDLLEATAGTPLYINAYWPAVDTLCHSFGPHHPSVAAEIRSTFGLLKTEFFERLSPAARKETAIFITADHGHVATPPELAINVEEDPTLMEMLLMRPAGEPRTPYLYARQGCQAALLKYLVERYENELMAMTSAQALTSGLLGPKPHAPGAARRLGDVVAVMREGYSMLTPQEAKGARSWSGRHGGMTVAEMEVPWLGVPLS